VNVNLISHATFAGPIILRNTLPPLAPNDLIINREAAESEPRKLRLLYQPFDQRRRPPLMKFYCGIDLSARDCHVCVIDQQLKIVVQQKLRNELPKICQH
jgi:hypothetical protein